jgi:hypothetical protein
MLDFNVATKKASGRKKAAAGSSEAKPPAPRNPFDIAPVRAALKVYEDEVGRMKATAENHQVIDEESNKTAIEMAAQAKRIVKTIEELRKEKVRPYQEYTKGIGNLAKVYTDQLEATERLLKQKINAYLTRQKLERLEAERRAQEEARKLQERLDAESAEKGLPQVEVPMPVLPQKQEPVRTEEGSASQTKEWKWRLVSKENVPWDYLMIDTIAVNKAVRAGIRLIPGIEIYQEENVRIRI